jgi:hypothetical protein
MGRGYLLLIAGLLAAGSLILEHPGLRTVLLLSTCVWCFCRFYCFTIYVIQHSLDPNFRFSGPGAFVGYLWWGIRN